jgi:DNA polymerase delta subunit 1
MIDNSIGGMQWIELQAGKYLQRADASKVSTCQYEIDVVDFRDVESVPLEIDSKIAPLRILSFDIECSSTTKGKFPTANEDPII